MPVVTRLRERSFCDYLLKNKKQVDNQQKIPRVSNNRDIANILIAQAKAPQANVNFEEVSKAG